MVLIVFVTLPLSAPWRVLLPTTQYILQATQHSESHYLDPPLRGLHLSATPNFLTSHHRQRELQYPVTVPLLAL